MFTVERPELDAASGESQPSVVPLRRPGRRPEERAEAIRTAFEAVEDGLESGALVSGFGPIRIGMTVDEGSAASGETLTVDPDLAPGPDCWHAVIEGDPYSPS